MPRLGPVARRVLIRKMKNLGFEGPFQGPDHAFMEKGTLAVRVPNPHGKDIGVPLLKRVLKQAGISNKEWFDA